MTAQDALDTEWTGICIEEAFNFEKQFTVGGIVAPRGINLVGRWTIGTPKRERAVGVEVDGGGAGKGILVFFELIGFVDDGFSGEKGLGRVMRSRMGGWGARAVKTTERWGLCGEAKPGEGASQVEGEHFCCLRRNGRHREAGRSAS